MVSSIFLQVHRELRELELKRREESCIADTMESYQNESFDQVMEWLNEVEKLSAEITMHMASQQLTFMWCKSALIRIRKTRAKRGPYLTSRYFGKLNMEPLSLREELYTEIKLLVNIYCSPFVTLPLCNNVDDAQTQLLKEMDDYVIMTKFQLNENANSDSNSDWYRNKIVETRAMIDRCEPAFSLQPHEMELISLHEQLRSEVRLLNNTIFVYLFTTNGILTDYTIFLEQKNAFIIELDEGRNEMIEFLTKINLQVGDINLEKNSDWYNNKIAETRTLVAKSYSAFPHRSQDIATNKKDRPLVFLSFRGADTRHGFTRNLYEALDHEGFNVFMDDERLEAGDSIADVLVKAIKSAKLSIIVFSEKYAESTWCLDEVVNIVECKEKNDQQVWAVFYKVEPSDVRYQNNSFKDAMLKHESRFGKDSVKVKRWRSSLSQVCDLKAFPYKENTEYESVIIKKIIKAAKDKKI